MISHRHKCIFTHVPKTAGKTIKSLFGLPEFGRDFIPEDTLIERAYGHYALSDLKPEPYFSHYFKFSFVRNPYDRLVSAFFYLNRGGANAGDRAFRDEHLLRYGGHFPSFVEDLAIFVNTTHFRPQCDWLCDADGEVLSDFVGRVEHLDQGIDYIKNRLGLSFDVVPVLNASQHEHYTSYYDSYTGRRVEEFFAKDLDLFSYRFPAAP